MDETQNVFDEFEAWYAHCRDSDALDPKTKALIGLAVVITGNCEP
jgi:alkylhydroperoxidase/carboxymuconolactone decarboxylase family protein YurZ